MGRDDELEGILDGDTMPSKKPIKSTDEGTRTMIGKYQLINELGKGGMGVVYLARDPDLDRAIALKIILGKHPELITRFERLCDVDDG